MDEMIRMKKYRLNPRFYMILKYLKVNKKLHETKFRVQLHTLKKDSFS